MKKNIGLQLSSVRMEMQRDLNGSLRIIAETGYQGIELWFPDEYPDAHGLRKQIDDLGLEITSCHIPYVRLIEKLQSVFEYQSELGVRDIVISGVPGNLRESTEDLEKIVEKINGIAEKTKGAGFSLHYHNHAWELNQKINDQFFLDYLFENIDTSLLGAELDTYFINLIGEDINKYIGKHSERVKFLHIKDQSKNPRYKQTAVGYGTINWPKVFRFTVTLPEVKWYLVEENCEEYPEFLEMAKSWKYLENLDIR